MPNRNPVTLSFANGSDVVVELPHEHGLALHYGTVHGRKPLPNGSVMHRVSGLPGQWIRATELTAAPRPETNGS